MTAKVKDKLLGKSNEHKYILTDWEFGYLKELDIALKTSIYHQRLMSGILTYIAKSRLGLSDPPSGHHFTFEIDLGGDAQELVVRQEKSTED